MNSRYIFFLTIISTLFFTFFLSSTQIHAAVISCGSGYATDNTTDTCNSSCPANGTYTDVNDFNTVKNCCGYVYGGRCNSTPPQTLACGSTFATDRDDVVCNSTCPGNGSFNDNGVIKKCCGYILSEEGSPSRCLTTPTRTVSCGNEMRQQSVASQVITSCSCGSGFTGQRTDNSGIRWNCCGWVDGPYTSGAQCIATNPQSTISCGALILASERQGKTCSCPNTSFTNNTNDPSQICCGYFYDNKCNIVPKPGTPSTGGGGTGAFFTSLNTAIFGNAGPSEDLTTPRGIIGRLLPYLFVFGGLILFVMLVWGGFEMLTGAANPKSQEAGKQRITTAFIGFILLFCSYWLAKILEIVFGISVL